MDNSNETMPDFTKEVEDTTNLVSQPESQTAPLDEAPKKRGRAKAEQKTQEEKKAQWSKYYEENKERKLKYKKAMRGTTRAPQNKCYLSTYHIPRYIKEGKAKPRINIDWVNFNGCHRFLTISQPTDEIIAFLRDQMKLPIEETITGTPDHATEAPMPSKATC